MKTADQFFAWLPGHLEDVFFDETVQGELSAKLAKVHPRLRWEVGSYGDDRRFFAFSPNLDLELLPLTDALAKEAPEIPGWVFLSSKPRKQWKSRLIELKSDKGETVCYNLDSWTYYLTKFKGGEFFDVNLVPYGSADRPLDDLQYVASLGVEFELGERMFIEFIDRTNIVLPSELNVVANAFEHLHDQILQELSANPHH